MKLNEAIEILRNHNEWRRGVEIPMTDPKALGEAIDCVVEHFADVSKMVGGIEERAQKYADEYVVGDAAIIVDLLHKVAEESYIVGATEQKEIDDAEYECMAQSYETGFAQGQEVGEREMIGKACEWIFGYIRSNDMKMVSAYDVERDFRKAMGISENEKEIPTNLKVLIETRNAFVAFCHNIINGMYVSVIDAAKEQLGYLENDSCDSDKNLQELTWQDIKRIVNIADDIADFDTYRNRHTGEEDYYTEVLKQFNERKED